MVGVELGERRWGRVVVEEEEEEEEGVSVSWEVGGWGGGWC